MSSNQSIHLYRSLLRHAKLFSDYNFKSYAVRRIKCGYAENRTLSDKAVIAAEYEKGVKELESLKRQVLVSSLYPETANVMTVG